MPPAVPEAIPPWEELAARVRGELTRSAGSLARVRGDGSHLRGDPGGLLTPADPEDVVEVVRWARRHGIGVVARGAGTSLDGESVPATGSLVVEFTGWDRVLEIDVEERLVRVQPGVVNHRLQEELRGHGLFFPPNPGSWRSSTVGGNAATNASGPRSLKYGPTRRWVRGWEAVLGSGERLRAERRAPKRSAGPDLVGLLVGSEGTLGIFTELLLEVAPLPEVRQAVVVPLPGVSEAVPAARAILRGPKRCAAVSALEFVDATVAGLLHEIPPGRLPAGRPLLLIELESRERSRGEDLAELAAALAGLGLDGEAIEFPNADEMWTLRGESGLALDRAYGERIREDVAVPLGAVGRLFQEIDRIAEELGVPLYTFAHLGEGSLHPNFVVDPASPTAERIRRELFDVVHRLGGTLSGEHGIGSLKAPYFELEHGRAGAEALERIRQQFDPDGILNPGKLYPRRSAPAGEGAPPHARSPSVEADGRTPPA